MSAWVVSAERFVRSFTKYTLLDSFNIVGVVMPFLGAFAANLGILAVESLVSNFLAVIALYWA
jgi:hypothetical protein